MRLFKERARQSLLIGLKKTLTTVGGFLFAILVSCTVLCLIMVFAIFILGTIIGQFPAIWAVIMMLGVFSFQYRDNIRKWVKWQFIEPFKSDNDEKK